MKITVHANKYTKHDKNDIVIHTKCIITFFGNTKIVLSIENHEHTTYLSPLGDIIPPLRDTLRIFCRYPELDNELKSHFRLYFYSAYGMRYLT